MPPSNLVSTVLVDLVVDTNVFVHALNKTVSMHRDSLDLIETMIECDTVLCLDEGFDENEAKNRSMIYSEYMDKLRVPGTPPRLLLESLALSQRIKEIGAPSRGIRDAIRQLVGNERRDRTFLGVAHGATERVLVSHDSRMSETRRRRIKERIQVEVVTAGNCVSLISQVT